jgi:hypothetical protein
MEEENERQAEEKKQIEARLREKMENKEREQ